MVSKVPEVTIWFWIIKILCTTVGESLADWINMALGVGLLATALIFTVVMAIVLTVQMRLRRYLPAPYWLTVVVLSVTGTLYTDILTDQLGVPLAVSSSIFAVVLAVVFGIWYARERTLSIHSITTTPREAFYWLAILVTFALGTAVGDWTLELTGWGPGWSILLPLALIAIVAGLWRLGGNPVLTFWIAYILTRPLGANIGDWLGLPQTDGGLGLGTLVTSLIFLAAILATVIYLSVSKVDVTERASSRNQPPNTPARRRSALVALGVVAVATIGLLTFINSLPHTSALADEAAAPTCSVGGPELTQDQAKAAAQAHFPADIMTELGSITNDIAGLVGQGDQTTAAARATDLETVWDDNQDALNGADCQAWSFIDKQIDPVLTSVRSSHPDEATKQQALQALQATLGA
ncbi:hypothetical protein GCM10010988_38580 [Cnuibacter physcomitrellae]|nr:hypothetical protein GCM10010988_38580 [Cnuibacter physcomitrellae]